MISLTTNQTEILEMQRLAWSPAEVSKFTGLSLAFVRKQIREGGIRAVNAGRRLLISDEELRRYLAEGSRSPQLE
jgi:excisionase family DNA binding protein